MEIWCTWKRVKVNERLYKDPNTFTIPEDITFIETGYTSGDNLFIGKIIGEETEINNFINSKPEFLVSEKTESEVLELLDTWYSDYDIKEGETEKFKIIDGQIIDNRYIPEVDI